jgi:hypothetical protein
VAGCQDIAKVDTVFSVVVTELSEIVGLNARRIRTDAGATLDDVAKAARGQGLTGWTVARVSDLEHGRVSPTVPTLVAVCLALGDIRHSPMTLAELLAYDGPVAINGNRSVGGAVLGRFLDGEPVELPAQDEPVLPDLDIDAFADSIQQLATSMGQIPVVLAAAGSRMMLGVHGRSGEAEQRMAKALGVDLMTVSVASSYLYRATASEERDRRAGADATAQKRGRIAREIQAELRAVLDGTD